MSSPTRRRIHSPRLRSRLAGPLAGRSPSPTPIIEPLEPRALLTTSPPGLVQLTNLLPTSTQSSTPHALTPFNGLLYYAADDGLHGTELFRTDGTATTLVSDLSPGPAPSSPQSLTPAGTSLFFIADDGSHGPELWKTDGTTPTLVKDIRPGPAGSAIDHLVAVGSAVYFEAQSSPNAPYQLWTSDGTPAGTHPVPTPAFLPNPQNNNHLTSNLTAFNGLAYFSADDGSHGQELWRTDGTTTTLVADLSPGTPGSFPTNLTATPAALYFLATDGTHGQELWSTDGTSPTLVKDIRPGPASSAITELTFFANRLYFAADDGTGNGPQLWSSDGSPAGTSPVLDSSNNRISDPAFLTPSGPTLYFRADDPTHGEELWHTDGTAAPSLLTDLTPGPAGTDLGALIPSSSGLYFLLGDPFDPATTPTLWHTDGTPTNTAPVPNAPLRLDPTATQLDLVDLSGTLFFPATDPTHGLELWHTTNGAPASLVADTNATATPQTFGPSYAVGATLYFTLDDGTHGPELWKSDGTPAGTSLVKDVNPGPAGSNITFLAAIGTTLYFSANDGVHGQELWKTDGTTTTLVHDISAGALSSSPTRAAVFNGALYFAATDPTAGTELWTTDGSDAGTRRVVNLNPGPASSSPFALTVVGNHLLFWANDGSHGAELFRTDGTTTTLLRDLNPGPSHSQDPTGNNFRPVLLNGLLFFTANDGAHGIELWSTDGSLAGTGMVADLNPGSAGILPFYADAHLTAVNNTLFFTADDGTHGTELWKTDGLTTSLVTDLTPGPAPSPITSLAALGNTLFFTTPTTLYKSDGTPAGTSALLGFPPTTLTPLLGSLYYQTDDPTHGYQLWQTTGTTPSLVADFGPGGTPAPFANLSTTPAQLFFTTYDPTAGRQLFALTPAPTTAPAIDLAPPSDTGSSPTDRLTNNPTPTLAGTANPGATLHLFLDNIPLAATPTADLTGHWTYALPQPLPAGPHTLAAYQSTLGGTSPTSVPVTFTLDLTPPTATLSPVAPPSNHAPSVDFTVTYTDALGLDPATVDDADLLITGPHNFSATAVKISATPSNDGHTLTAVYRLTLPTPFTSAANGTYTLSLAAGAISDTAGNPIPPTTLGTFRVNLPIDAPPPDTTPPTISLSSAATPALDDTSWDFTLSLSDESGINPASLTPGTVLVTGPHNFSAPATLLSFTPSPTGALATYRLPAPGGFFDPADNGPYTLTTLPGAASDNVGNPTPATTLGPVTLQLPTPPPAPDLSGSVLSAPSTIPPGSKNNPLTLRLTNTGPRPFGGKLAVRLYALPADADPSDLSNAIPLGTATTNTIVASNRSTTAKLTFNAPTTAIPDGSYRLVAVLDAGKTPETYKSNNTLLSPKPTRFTSPSADLSLTLKSTPASVGKKKAKVLVTLTNKGNTTAIGPATISLYASPDRSLDTLLSKAAQKLNLKPGASVTFNLSAITSPALANTRDFLAATLTYTGSPTDPNPANDTVFSKAQVKFTA